jgi:DNA replication and repair protein RecF
MKLTHVYCHAFRCLQQVQFAPSPRVNIIHGDNAQGKTSLLEAVLFAATSKSHRTTSEAELVGHDADGFQIRLHAARHDRDVQIEAIHWQGAKRFKVNGVTQTRISDILGKISLVLFTPEDISLIKGSATHRRRFLDMELSQLQQPYLHALQRYRQVLRQRNELLRTGHPEAALLDVWDVQLVEYGARLMLERKAFLEELALFTEQAYGKIASGERLSVRYAPDVADVEALAPTLARSRKSDLRRGITGHGPHRDDFEVLIDDRPARQYGSQGQQKSAALALKLAEMALIRQRTGEDPVLMLDEVLAELDESRAARLFDAIGPDVQCILTTTEPAHHQTAFGADGARFEMKRGRLEAQ